MEITRIDQYLVQQGWLESRTKAALAIERGYVQCNGKVVKKPSFSVTEKDEVLLLKKPLSYVGLGGEKLETAIEKFQLDFAGKTVLDIGSSTGGFADCALQFGASKVICVDNGTDQLHASLKCNESIVLHEGTDARLITPDKITNGRPVDVVTIDVSFISSTQFFDTISLFLKPGGDVILLVKPQFEQSVKTNHGNGVIKDPRVRLKAVDKVRSEASYKGFVVAGITETNADGKNKNIEYLLWLRKM